MADFRPLVIIFVLVCLAAGATKSTTPTPSSTPKHGTISTTSSPDTTTSIEEECGKYNKSCDKCVSNSKCLYCKTDGTCMKYPVGQVIPRSADCALSDARWGVCWVNFEALLIAAGVIGGVILIAIGVCVYCCCCRDKKKRYEKEDAKYEQQKMERKVKQDERKTERKSRLDEIRRKYGLMKDESPYSRFDA